MDTRTIDLEAVEKIATQLSQPSDYFSGKDWGHLLLPQEVLCFLRKKQTDEEGWSAISTSSKRYDQHRRFVLLIALEGTGQVGVETSLWNMAPGVGLLLFPHQAHYYAELPERFSWLFVTYELPLVFWPAIQELRDSPRNLTAEIVPQIQNFLQIWQAAEDSMGALEAARLLGEILLSLVDCAPVNSLGIESDLVKSVRDRVEANLTADLSVKALADHLEVSGSYLREQFRKGAGISLGHFVRSMRLIAATRLLRESNLSVRQVAEQSGFGSFTAFSRAFGQVYGASPSVYRRTVARSLGDFSRLESGQDEAFPAGR